MPIVPGPRLAATGMAKSVRIKSLILSIPRARSIKMWAVRDRRRARRPHWRGDRPGARPPIVSTRSRAFWRVRTFSAISSRPSRRTTMGLTFRTEDNAFCKALIRPLRICKFEVVQGQNDGYLGANSFPFCAGFARQSDPARSSRRASRHMKPTAAEPAPESKAQNIIFVFQLLGGGLNGGEGAG